MRSLQRGPAEFYTSAASARERSTQLPVQNKTDNYTVSYLIQNNNMIYIKCIFVTDQHFFIQLKIFICLSVQCARVQFFF